MKRLLVGALWLFFAPAILLLHAMRWLAFWLIRHTPDGRAWDPRPDRSRRARGRLPRVP